MRSFLEYYQSDGGLVFLRRQSRLLAAAFVLLTLFVQTDLDREVTGRFFDAGGGVFPLMNDWWLKTVLHDTVRAAAALAALAVLAVTCAAWLVPSFAADSRRQELTFVAIATLCCAAIITALKHYSGRACPWNLVDFGGLVPYHASLVRQAAQHEGCFPAAHPLVGYAWLCVGFALYPRAPHAARISAGLALVLGTVAGAVQVVRGAHFVSHVLWTAWDVWAIDVALLASCRLGSGRLSRTRMPSACWPTASRRRA